MTEARIDFYTLIHKGIRRELFGVAAQAGTTDWADDRSVEALHIRLRSLLGTLQAHAEHEERFAFPLLAAAVPGGAKALIAEHRDEAEQMHDLETHFLRVQAEPPEHEKRPALGLEFYRAFNRFVAHCLEHLDEEEERSMPAMWELCTATDLSEAMAAFQVSQELQAAMDSLTLMLPALNLPERAALLHGIRDTTPPGDAETAFRLAERVLSPEDWRALQARLLDGIATPSGSSSPEP